MAQMNLKVGDIVQVKNKRVGWSNYYKYDEILKIEECKYKNELCERGNCKICQGNISLKLCEQKCHGYGKFGFILMKCPKKEIVEARKYILPKFKRIEQLRVEEAI